MRYKTTAERSRDFMRKEGWHAEVVEHRLGSFIRRDLFNVADVLAYKEGEGILMIQAFRDRDSSKHSHFTAGVPEISEWLHAGGKFELQIWHKGPKKRGGRHLWSVRRVGLLSAAKQ